MARLITTGAEVAATGLTLGQPDGFPSGSPTRDTGIFRSGAASFKCPANARYEFVPLTGTAFPASATRFARIYIQVDAMPGSVMAVMYASGNSSSASTTGVSAKLTSAGKLQLFNEVTDAQIGSDSAVTLVTGTWYRIEISTIMNGSPQVTDAELRLDGTTVASITGATITSGGSFFAGSINGGTGVNLYLDDVALNSDAGAANNTWPGNGKVVLLVPISDSAIGGWTGGAGGTTNLFAAVDNTPPVGVVDPGTNTSQIRNASANNSYDANLTSYTTAGVGASDTVNVLLPMCNVGAPVVTGAKTGSFGIVSNPAITNRVFTGGTSAAANFWRGAAPGTWPTNWGSGWELGTTTEAPSVTLGTSPVARLTITGGTASRIAMCDFIGMYVDYTPAVAGATSDPTTWINDRRTPRRRSMQRW